MLQHCGHMPAQLFTEPHPGRSVAAARVMLKTFFAVRLPRKGMMLASIARFERAVVRIHCVAQSGELFEVMQTIQEPWSESETKVAKLAVVERGCIGRVGILRSVKGRLLLFAVGEAGALVEVDARTGDAQAIAGHIGRVNCVCASQDLLVTGGSDATTNIYQIEARKSPLHSLTSFRDEIVACAVCQEFGLAASLTREGSVVLIAAGTGTTLKVLEVEAPEMPCLVAITRGWGFVLVYSTKLVDGISSFFVTVYSANGNLIRKVRIEFAIETWTTWVSKSGFDYVAAVVGTADVYVFEAYFANLVQVAKVVLPVIAMEFLVDEELLVVVTDAQVYVYSAAQLRLERLETISFGRAAT